MLNIGRKSDLFTALNPFIDEEYVIYKIIWEVIFREIYEIAETKRRHKDVMFPILVNSHCCVWLRKAD